MACNVVAFSEGATNGKEKWTGILAQASGGVASK
jgi:hypothetical protein